MRLMPGALLLLGLIAIAEVRADDLPKATLYRNSNCGCCLEYARYLRRQGFDVDVVVGGMTSVRDEHGVPEDLEGCHTMVIGGYVIEGHVPAPSIKRLLAAGDPRHLAAGNAKRLARDDRSEAGRFHDLRDRRRPAKRSTALTDGKARPSAAASVDTRLALPAAECPPRRPDECGDGGWLSAGRKRNWRTADAGAFRRRWLR